MTRKESSLSFGLDKGVLIRKVDEFCFQGDAVSAGRLEVQYHQLCFLAKKSQQSSTMYMECILDIVVPTTFDGFTDLQPKKQHGAFMNLMVKSANLLTTIPFNHPPPERRRTIRTTVLKAIPLNVFDPPETEFSVVANWYLGFLWVVGGDMGGWSWTWSCLKICFFVRK